MVIYILYAIFFISCIVLIASVLLQPGKTDAGALFTSNISSTAFNPRGTQTVLSKITIGAAVAFMLSALLISMPALTGDVSVLSTTTAEQEAPAGANTNANTANPAGDVNSNTLDVNSAFTQPAPNINVNAASNATPPKTAAAVNSINAPATKDAPKPAPTKK